MGTTTVSSIGDTSDRIIGIMEPAWKLVTEEYPEEYVTVILHRTGDLYPVIGSRLICPSDHHHWALEEGGPEDGEHREYPWVGQEGWQPTHWAPLPLTPEVLHGKFVADRNRNTKEAGDE